MKWVITRVETDEVIEIYKGSFMDVMNYVSKVYEDGAIDIESYENWLNRQQKGKYQWIAEIVDITGQTEMKMVN